MPIPDFEPPCASTPRPSAGYGAGGYAGLRLTHVFLLRSRFAAPSLYVCLLPQASPTAPRSGQKNFCAHAYPPEIMVHVRMGVYAANVDALLIHYCKWQLTQRDRRQAEGPKQNFTPPG